MNKQTPTLYKLVEQLHAKVDKLLKAVNGPQSVALYDETGEISKEIIEKLTENMADNSIKICDVTPDKGTWKIKRCEKIQNKILPAFVVVTPEEQIICRTFKYGKAKEIITGHKMFKCVKLFRQKRDDVNTLGELQTLDQTFISDMITLAAKDEEDE